MRVRRPMTTTSSSEMTASMGSSGSDTPGRPSTSVMSWRTVIMTGVVLTQLPTYPVALII
ncbi:hypothetical protein B0I32_15313 [Nonomuraea fuscirosea]|uniref:Uncharacterized protein n=2 Tax=Nonomuraea fuscirosea TaxID=1291556 RepID=A0A2T0LM00_9ACTN|nr:hypothetical protein B0I32_15313 [Nonomuraea fuscirosea]